MHSLKAEAGRDSAEFPHFLSNHLPMILVAMERLGAEDRRITAFAETYRLANGLVLPPPATGAPVTRATWEQSLGDRAREAGLRMFFAGEVARLGIDGAILDYLPRLAPGVAGSAFHPLMRLAYGVMTEDAAETGIALGYWAATYLPLSRGGVAAPLTADPVAFLRHVAAMPGLGAAEPESDLLWHHMRAVARMPGFDAVSDWLTVEAETLDRMASAALALYAGTMSFEALHALTGCHWLRQLCPLLPDSAPLLRHFWTGIAALLPKMLYPAFPDAAQLAAWRGLAVPHWDEISRAAVASDDEHDISLAFSAREEWRRTGDRLYAVVAAKRMGLIE